MILRKQFLAHVAQTSPSPILVEVARAEGSFFYTPEGKRYFDLVAGVSVSNVGHGNPAVVRAVQEQAARYMHVMVYGELVETPQVLILDEATANIDSGTEQAIQQALAKVREHTTLVVIAHRLSTIVEADTILVLHRGQAVERGNHQQLLAAKGRYWQMYQLQLAGEELAASAQEESLSA